MFVATKPGARQAQQSRQSWTKGIEFSRKGRWEDAARAFESALKLTPNDDVVLLNAARACLQVGRLQDALKYSTQAKALVPDSELAVLLQARVLNQMQRHHETLVCLRSLPQGAPRSVDYWTTMGFAAQNIGEHQEAISALMNALALKLDDAMLHYGLGLSFYGLELKEEASECVRTGLLLGLGSYTLHARGLLAFTERENCRWPQAADEEALMRQMVNESPADAAIMTSPFAHATLTDDPLHQLKACGLMANTWGGLAPVKRPPRSKGCARIRLGYLSSDMHLHATCVLMSEVFEHHDRNAFEVFVYSHGPDDGSDMRQRVVKAVEHFVDVKGIGDLEIAERIAQDGLDVLIDLKGYTTHNRMGVMARRPAPVQAAFLGFPATTGADFIDYIIGDTVVTPLGHAAHFAESIAQMPVCYQPNDRKRPRPQALSRQQVGLPQDALVLCGFNQAYKISPQVLDVWCGLLAELPQAVLWLLDWHGQARPNLEDELRARGVDLARVHWAPKWGLADHISRLALADIFIDTWPCNAHTTASDALWAGVPMVTLQGQTFASRVAASLLEACGLPELVVHDVQQYRAAVVTLANDEPRRLELRRHLSDARDHNALFDSARFTRDFEALLTRMVERERAGAAPEHLPAAPSASS